MIHRAFLIIGGGHFGSRAAEQLLRQNTHSKITVVDKDAGVLRRLRALPVSLVHEDGVSFLDQLLQKGHPIDYIIPAVPFHLAFEYLLLKLRPFGMKRTRVPAPGGLPNLQFGQKGDLYSSFANFLCPEDCPEPPRRCWVTGEMREKPLYKLLGEAFGNCEARVIRSQQLGPGVGGFPPKALVAIVEALKRRKKPLKLTVISTASRCHGVTSALTYSART